MITSKPVLTSLAQRFSQFCHKLVGCDRPPMDIIVNDSSESVKPKKWKKNANKGYSKVKGKELEIIETEISVKPKTKMIQNDNNTLEIDRIMLKKENEEIVKNQKKPNSVAGSPAKIRKTGPWSLKVLSAAQICKHVNLYKSTKLHIPNEILSKLLKIMVQFNYINDSNFPFFLSETYENLEIKIPTINDQITDHSLVLAPICCPNLKYFHLKNSVEFSKKGWKNFVESAKSSGLSQKLQHLSFINVPIYEKEFTLVCKTFKALKVFDLSHNFIIRQPTALQCLIEQHKNLTELYLKNINLTSDAIQSISNGFNNLEILDISVTTWDPHQTYASPESLATLSKLTTLKQLFLNGLSFNNNTISSICKKCVSLEVFDLSWPDPNSKYVWTIPITDAVLVDVVNCVNLEELGLGYSSRIRNEQSLTTLFTFLPNLTKLNLTAVPAVTDNSVTHLTKCCPNLKRLKLQHCVLNSTSLFAIASNCSKLEYLDVRAENNIFNDSSWEAIASGCPGLETALGTMTSHVRLHLQMHCPKLKFKFQNPLVFQIFNYFLFYGKLIYLIRSQSFEEFCSQVWGDA